MLTDHIVYTLSKASGFSQRKGSNRLPNEVNLSVPTNVVLVGNAYQPTFQVTTVVLISPQLEMSLTIWARPGRFSREGPGMSVSNRL